VPAGIDSLLRQLYGVFTRADKQRVLLTQPASRAWQESRARDLPDDSGTRRVSVSYAGLYGRFGVLPDYFTDELLQDVDERRGMHDFFDMFNQRLLGLLYQAWRRYHLLQEDLLEPADERARAEARYLDRLSGLLHSLDAEPAFRGLRWSHIGLYRRPARTLTGLQTLIEAFFPDVRFEIETFVPAYRDIPPEQQVCLGVMPVKLGADGNFLAGRRVKDIGGTIRIVFRALDYRTYTQLLPGGLWRTYLARLVNDYTHRAYDCLVRLELLPEEVPEWRLGLSIGGREPGLGLDFWAKSRAPDEPVLVEAGMLA